MEVAAISTVILAGGPGSRIGGNKALQQLNGMTLIEWVLQAMRPQGDEVFINANADDAAYREFGCCVIADQTSGSAGPLVGLQAALQRAHHDLVLSVPCDTPFLPKDLARRLLAAIHAGTVEAAVAVAAGRRQPTIALYRKRVLPKLNAYLNTGGRKAGAWLESLKLCEVQFDEPAEFININTSQELRCANRILQLGGGCRDVQHAFA